MARQTKTPKQRAQEALGVAERRYNRAIAHRDRLEEELTAAEIELREALELRAYAKQHPALQSTTPTTTEETTHP